MTTAVFVDNEKEDTNAANVAKACLRVIKMTAGESAQLFAERVVSEANDARPNLGIPFVGPLDMAR